MMDGLCSIYYQSNDLFSVSGCNEEIKSFLMVFFS